MAAIPRPQFGGKLPDRRQQYLFLAGMFGGWGGRR